MKASVIMGVYNCEESLGQSLDSLFKQTFQDFDIILCEDGSEDKTILIALDYLKKYPDKITLLQNETNAGLAHSLNRCLAVSRSEYIIRMDADDVARSDRFEKQLAYLDEHPEFSLVGSNAALFDERGVWGVRRTPPFPSTKDFLYSSPFIHPSIIVRRQVLVDLGGYKEEQDTLRTEDYDLFMRMYSAGYLGANLQELLLYYCEDTRTYKRRAYRLRMDEAKVRFRGFKSLGLFPLGYLFVAKPLVVGLLPQKLLRLLRMEKIV